MTTSPLRWRRLASVGATLALCLILPTMSSGAVPRSARWQWPLAGVHAIAAPFAAPPSPYASGHRGIDLAAPVGTAVLAPASGTIAFAGRVVDRPVLTITHGGGYLSSYEPVVTTLTVGDAITRGQVIGTVAGDRTHCQPRCLHVGVRLDGEYINPLLLLGSLERSVLLPLN